MNGYKYVIFNSCKTFSYHSLRMEIIGMAIMVADRAVFENLPCYRLAFCPPKVRDVVTVCTLNIRLFPLSSVHLGNISTPFVTKSSF